MRTTRACASGARTFLEARSSHCASLASSGGSSEGGNESSTSRGTGEVLLACRERSQEEPRRRGGRGVQRRGRKPAKVSSSSVLRVLRASAVWIENRREPQRLVDPVAQRTTLAIAFVSPSVPSQTIPCAAHWWPRNAGVTGTLVANGTSEP